MEITYYQVFGREGPFEVFETLIVGDIKNPYVSYKEIKNLNKFFGFQKTNMSKKLNIKQIRICKTIVHTSTVEREWSEIYNQT